MAKKPKKARKRASGIEINPGLGGTHAWTVRGNTQSFTVNADRLEVTEAGCLIFLVSGIQTFVMPAGQYVYATRSGLEIRAEIDYQIEKAVEDSVTGQG